jgi:membrane-associated phospholipid phosphatase
VLVVLGVLIVSVIMAATIDMPIMAWAERQGGRVLRAFRIITRFGKSDWVLWSTIIGFVVILCGDWSRVGKRVAAAWREVAIIAAFLFFSVAISGILVNIIKQFIGRARPPALEGPFSFDPFTYHYLHQAYPSGHSQVAGALAAVALLVAPRYGLLVVLGCLVIAVSRVMVDAHYPSDVLAGLALGGGFAWLYAKALAGVGIGFDLRPNGSPVARTRAIREAGARVMLRGLSTALTGLPRPAENPLRDRR